MFGSPKGSRNFNLGDHLLGLGTQAKTPGSPRGSLKFSLEHSLAGTICNDIIIPKSQIVFTELLT